MVQSFQQRILAAANKIFIDKGYRDADMRSIAKEAGIAVGTIYNYYPTKAALYQDILSQQWQELDRAIAQLTEENRPPKEKIGRITDRLFEFVAQHMSMWHEIVEDPNRSSILRDEGQKAQALAHDQLKRHLRRVFEELGTASDVTERHVLTYIAAVTRIGMWFPAEKAKNEQYVMSLINNMLRTS
ncbi:TetR/AcrR family transcriptional regulator [Aneurinibacillus sp. Ricciae_BoGa-3]|uniref:TetR/AcrR family transcriptional regulator n=1 Tax=Aneurinibacillus sp. Ricciae_BoGa-3 TaxID=3022697 RepID=UPI002340D62C|nr:TetR/AcrR family transcriptional regulator [Aneurinibacillus sp. Ricciae_BoGa-3]WCK53096.1 TetR/AcrR family transcriptional regulator [Aneurinibacillus sp. Ricciae_BoGa-3]